MRFIGRSDSEDVRTAFEGLEQPKDLRPSDWNWRCPYQLQIGYPLHKKAPVTNQPEVSNTTDLIKSSWTMNNCRCISNLHKAQVSTSSMECPVNIEHLQWRDCGQPRLRRLTLGFIAETRFLAMGSTSLPLLHTFAVSYIIWARGFRWVVNQRETRIRKVKEFLVYL